MRLTKDERELIRSALLDRHDKLDESYTKLLNLTSPLSPVLEKLVVKKQEVNALLIRLEREDARD